MTYTAIRLASDHQLPYGFNVSTVAEIEDALRALALKDARAVADWLQDYLDQRWDKQIEVDAANGGLDRVWQKAQAGIAAGRAKPLDEVINDE
jgi:hypothetical protein